MRTLAVAVVAIGTLLTAVVGGAAYFIVSQLGELTDELATVKDLALEVESLSGDFSALRSTGMRIQGPVTAWDAARTR